VRWSQVFAQDADASMEQVAEAAGLTRITVHRRFANRQALLEALAVSAKQQARLTGLLPTVGEAGSVQHGSS
jgi:AcrR family transcriptional regulator